MENPKEYLIERYEESLKYGKRSLENLDTAKGHESKRHFSELSRLNGEMQKYEAEIEKCERVLEWLNEVK